MHQHPQRFSAIAIDYFCLNERDDPLREAAGAPILVSKCDRDRWFGETIRTNEGCR